MNKDTATTSSRVFEKIINIKSPIRTAIDDSATICKQTVQALRFLYKAGRITNNMKQLLIADIIENLTLDKMSLTEIAYEMLYIYPRKERETSNYKASEDNQIVGTGLEDFADQCDIIISKLSETSPYATIYELEDYNLNINNNKQNNNKIYDNNNRKNLKNMNSNKEILSSNKDDEMIIIDDLDDDFLQSP